MTFPLEHGDWQQRWLNCAKDRDPRFQDFAGRVKRMAGPAHKAGTGWEQGSFDPINHTFSAVAQWASQLAYGLPRAKVGSSRDSSKNTAQSGEAALNRLIHQSNLRQTNEMFATDMWLDFAVCLTTSEPAPGYSEWEDPPHWPTDTRVPPWEMLYDEQSFELKQCRYIGHPVVRDVAAVLEEADGDPTWDKTVLQGIKGRIVEHPEPVKAGQVSPQTENRGRFRYGEFYCPEVTAADLKALGYDPGSRDEEGREFNAKGGYHGAIFTVLDPDEGHADVFPRAPRMWWGPRGGPYTVCIGYTLPNDVLGLSPDTASRGQQVVDNDVARACLAAIERAKNIAFVASNAPDIADACKSATDGGVVVVRDAQEIGNRLKDVKLGGLYAELLTAKAWTTDLAQQATGMGPSQLGEELPGVTATQTAVAASASSARLGFLDVKFREFQAERLRKWLWYVIKDERLVLVMPEEKLGEPGPDGKPQYVKPIHVGGDSQAMALKQAARMDPSIVQQIEAQVLAATGEQMEFAEILAALKEEEESDPEREANEDEIDRLDLTVDPLSMSRTSEGMQQARLQTQMSLLLPMFQAMVQAPFWDWEDQLRECGDMINMPGLEKRLDMNVLRGMQQLMIGTMFPPPGEEQKPASPRVAKDKAPTPLKPAGGAQMPGRSTGSMAGGASKPGAGMKPAAPKMGGAK